MNEYDTELVRCILLENKHEIVAKELEADIILLNTCAVRENAFNKIYARVGDLKFLRKAKKTRVGILGCMAQNLKNDLLLNKNIDFTLGPDSYRELPKLISESLDQKPVKSITDLSEFETYSDIEPQRDNQSNAWLAIMRGCDNFCTFCVVPYTRGRERSRELASVVEEAKTIASNGIPQITLLGQNVNSYKSGEDSFADLMEAVAQIEGIKRIRFTSPHPKDFPEDLLHVIAKYPNICKQIHLPLQSGNDEVLDKMNRDYTRKEFIELAQKMRAIIPGVHISTDIIIGFPSETREQFNDTASLMEEVRFDSAYIFKYSPREGTLAKRKFADDVSAEEKKYRIMLLNDIQKRHSKETLERMVGNEYEILIEKEKTPISESQCQGKTDQGITVVIPQDGSLKCGDIVSASIANTTSHVLIAKEPSLSGVS
jgi:tRNA-2-methylthio-N6-dimethylallyladenosine synthase